MRGSEQVHFEQEGVAVVIPTTGSRPELLTRALETIVAQKTAPVEVVIAAHPAAPSTIVVPEPLRATTKVAAGRPGISGNLNAALSEVDASIVLMLCDDDLLNPEAVALVSGAFAEHPDAAVVFGAIQDRPDGPVTPAATPGRLAGLGAIRMLADGALRPGVLSNVAFRHGRDTLELFDETLRYALDHAAYATLLSRGDAVILDEALAVNGRAEGRQSMSLGWRTRVVEQAEAARRAYVLAGAEELAYRSWWARLTSFRFIEWLLMLRRRQIGRAIEVGTEPIRSIGRGAGDAITRLKHARRDRRT